ncbi:MAG: uracil-DNA glycosylase [Patescibacteria group bacterium]
METGFKDETLELIAGEIRICKKCPLYSGRLNAVPGSGTGKSGIVFIGEGPGAREDKIGVPFVGAAGKFLDEMLADIGLSRSDVFITNVVKCRPPDNRDPEPSEAAICTDTFLWRQLEAINPKLIVTLGRHAMHRFISGDKKIGDVHGTFFNLMSPKTGKTFSILPLYHPAAALYNGGMRGVLKGDFKKILKTSNQQT